MIVVLYITKLINLKPLLTIAIFLCAFATIKAQETSRVAVQGKIIGNNDVEGITIYNTSSNKGTVTDAEGNFTITVALHDIIEVSALQYESKNITINKDVMMSKQLRLFLVEALNALNEIILLPSNLTGNLPVDILSAEKQKFILMNFGNLGYMTFPEDEFTKPVNTITQEGTFYNGINFASLLGLNNILNKPLKIQSLQLLRDARPTDLLDVYSPKYIHNTYKIPQSDVEAFVAYLIRDGFDEALLKPENEIQLIELLVEKSEQFLNQANDKN